MMRETSWSCKEKIEKCARSDSAAALPFSCFPVTSAPACVIWFIREQIRGCAFLATNPAFLRRQAGARRQRSPTMKPIRLALAALLPCLMIAVSAPAADPPKPKSNPKVTDPKAVLDDSATRQAQLKRAFE